MLSLGSSIHAQDSGATVFMGAKSDVGWGITATQDGGYLVVGGTDSVGAGKEDGLILKLDAQRHIQWSLVLGGPLDDEFEQAVQTPDGGYAVCGGSYSFNHVGSSGWATPWLVRLNSSGQVLWQRYYVRPQAAWVWRIVNTLDGGFALCGVWWAPSTSGYPPQYSYLMKLSAAGEVQWQKAFGPDDVILKGLCQLSTGGFAAVGYCYYAGVSSPLEAVLRLDTDGNLLWYRRFEIPNDYNSSESPSAVTEARDGGIVVGGGNPGQIRKLDRDGNTLWSQRAAIVVEHEDWATIHSLLPLDGGGYYAAGNFSHMGVYSQDNYGGSLLIKLDEDGTILWARGYIANARDPSSTQACLTQDGGVAFIGPIPSPTDSVTTVLVKTDSEGNLSDPCMVTRDIRNLWTSEPSQESSISQEAIEATCESLVPSPVPSTANLDSEDTLCPVIRSVKILQNPFRLDVKGFNLWWGAYVYVNGQQAPGTKHISTSEQIGKGGDALKRMLPKGQPVCIQIGEPVEPPYFSESYTFRR
jgi:hypothetical protein